MQMSERPDLTKKLDGETFRTFYYLKEELVDFCRENNLPVSGGKVELTDTNADIFGVSQGGMIAQYLAIDRPDLVNQLVLAVTLSKNNETVERTVNDWIHITEQNNMKRLITDMAEKMYSDIYVKRYKPFMSLLAVLQKPKNVPRFIALAKACLSCKAYDELDKIQCPVFVIGGMQDKVVSGEASLEIAKKLDCEIFMYDDLGHAAYEEAKDFNQRVYNFLQHK